jgi:hypothetical protein
VLQRADLTAGLAVYELIEWEQYKQAVGAENSTLHGFRIWKSQRRSRRR